MDKNGGLIGFEISGLGAEIQEKNSDSPVCQVSGNVYLQWMSLWP